MSPPSSPSAAGRAAPDVPLPGADLRLAVICDPLDEGWPSMDLVADMLHQELRAGGVPAERIRPGLRRLARALPGVGAGRTALNVDRLLGRYLEYPARLWPARSRFEAFHVADHSYAQLVHVLPAGRAGVFCHDLDTFRCLLDPAAEPRPAWFRALTLLTLEGLRRAAVVFHSTAAVGLDLRIASPCRLSFLSADPPLECERSFQNAEF